MFIPFYSIPFHSISFHFISIHSLHFIPFHSIPCYSIPFHFTSFHSIPFHFISFCFILFHFIVMLIPFGSIPFHVISIQFNSFHSCLFHFISWSFHFIPFHSISFHFNSFTSFHFIPFHLISFHFVSFHVHVHVIPFHSISFHFVSFHLISYSISFHFVSFHSILLHFISLQFISFIWFCFIPFHFISYPFMFMHFHVPSFSFCFFIHPSIRSFPFLSFPFLSVPFIQSVSHSLSMLDLFEVLLWREVLQAPILGGWALKYLRNQGSWGAVGVQVDYELLMSQCNSTKPLGFSPQERLACTQWPAFVASEHNSAEALFQGIKNEHNQDLQSMITPSHFLHTSLLNLVNQLVKLAWGHPIFQKETVQNESIKELPTCGASEYTDSTNSKSGLHGLERLPSARPAIAITWIKNPGVRVYFENKAFQSLFT